MASVPNNYEINVAKKENSEDKYGVHFCKIQLTGINWEELAEERLKFFRELFGDMYHVSMTHWNCYGEIKEGWE